MQLWLMAWFSRLCWVSVRPEQLQGCLRLLHAATVCQAPALGQPAQAVHRELYEDAGIRCSHGSWHGPAGCVG